MRYRKFMLKAAAFAGLAAGGFLLGLHERRTDRTELPRNAEETQDSLTYGEVNRYVPSSHTLENLRFYDLNADRRDDAIFTYSYIGYGAMGTNRDPGHLGILISNPSKPNRYKIKRYSFLYHPVPDPEHYAELSVSHDNRLEVRSTFFMPGDSRDYMTYIFRVNGNDVQQVGEIPNMIRSLYNGTIIAKGPMMDEGKCDECPHERMDVYRWDNNRNRYGWTLGVYVPRHVAAARNELISLMSGSARGRFLEGRVREILDNVPRRYRHFALLSIPESIDSIYGDVLGNEDIERLEEFRAIATNQIALYATDDEYTGSRFLVSAIRELEAQRLMEEGRRLR